MSSAQPQNTSHAGAGLLYVNQSEASNYQPLRVERGDNHLYWQSTYQNLLLGYANFYDFFPRAEFSDNGNRVIFTKYIDGTEVLGKSRTLRSAECIDRLEWDRFLATWRSFKSLANQSGMPEDMRTFIINFAPPSIELFPSAYRVYKRRWYSKPRLFILWGFEPVGGPQFVDVSPDVKIAELQSRVESSATKAKNNFLKLLKWYLLGLLSLAVIMLLVWLFLPTPISDFDINAQVNRSADIVNKTSFDSHFKYGSTTYLWNFQNANPTKSVEFQPIDVVWTQPEVAIVSLEVKQITMFGLLSKKDISNKIISISLPTKDPKGLDSSLPSPSIPESVPVPESPHDKLSPIPSLLNPQIPNPMNPEAVDGQRGQMASDNNDNAMDSGSGSSSRGTGENLYRILTIHLTQRKMMIPVSRVVIRNLKTKLSLSQKVPKEAKGMINWVFQKMNHLCQQL